MTDETSRVPRRRLLLGGALVAAVAAGGLALALTTGGPDGGGDAASPAASATPSRTPVPDPATPAPTAGAPGATPTADAAPAPADAVPADPAAPVAPSPTERPDGRAQATVPLEQTVEVRTGVTARISQLEAVEAVANLPGEIGGPGLRATVEVRNDTAAPVDLTSAVINAYVGPDARPAVSVVAGSESFPLVVEPGASATARAVVTVPVEERGDVRVELDLALGDVIVLFTGDASGL